MREKVLEVLRERNEELTEDVTKDLLASGILDSFDIVNLVMDLEEAFDITIDIDLVTPDNFRTADAICALVESIVTA